MANCRKGDLAIIVRTDPRLGINGKPVKLTNDEPFMHAGLLHWTLEEPIRIVMPGFGFSLSTGQLYVPSDRMIARAWADAYLTPVRNPGDDAVDEMVKRVGPAPMTLTEVLEWGYA